MNFLGVLLRVEWIGVCQYVFTDDIYFITFLEIATRRDTTPDSGVCWLRPANIQFEKGTSISCSPPTMYHKKESLLSEKHTS